jgi:hypothetical protein
VSAKASDNPTRTVARTTRAYANARSPCAADCLDFAQQAEQQAELSNLPSERSRLLASATRWRALAKCHERQS